MKLSNCSSCCLGFNDPSKFSFQEYPEEQLTAIFCYVREF